MKEAAQWARAWNQGLGSVLYTYGLEPLWPVLAREGLRPFLRKGFGRWPDLGWFTVPPWVRADFARKYALRSRGRAHGRRMFRYPTGVSLDLNTLEGSAGDWGRWHMAAPRGLDVSHPFRDPRLICFALGLPRELRGDPTQAKPVLQEAMRGVLPEAVRTRRGKRGFDGVYGLGLARSLPHLERMIQQSSIRELGLFEMDHLLPALRQAALGVGDVNACERLDKTLALVAWFDQVVQSRPHASPTVVYHLGRPWNDREVEPRETIGVA